MDSIQFNQLQAIPDSDIRNATLFAALTTDSNGVQYVGTLTVDQLFNSGGTGCGCVYTAKLVIPSADVLTLNATPVPFGITVPTGFYISPLRADCFIDFNSAAYAANTNLRIRAVGATAGDYILGANGILAAAGNTFAGLSMQNGAANSINFITAADFEVFVPTGNPTTGDSDVTIYLTYLLIEA
jgi:hypothetical protein